MAEEIDVEKCNFQNFRSSVTLTLDRVSHTGAHIWSRSTYHDIRSNLEKKICGWMYRRTVPIC